MRQIKGCCHSLASRGELSPQLQAVDKGALTKWMNLSAFQLRQLFQPGVKVLCEYQRPAAMRGRLAN
jgi:hypothetical protein